MAYSSNAFGGQTQPWALYLGTWGFEQLARAGSRAPFVASWNFEPCVIMPKVEPDNIHLAVYYGAKRSFSVQRVLDTSPFHLAAEWRKFCRAYVICDLATTFGPKLYGWDHNCTRNAKSELMLLRNLQLPSLAELDAVLGTSLELSATKPLERAEAILESHHA